MNEIPAEDLKEMELDEAMDSDQDSEEEEEEKEEEEEDDRQKEAFIPGKHSIEKDEELVRDERLEKL